jgi:hypothetical protein
LRGYLIPRVVAILNPVSDYAFTLGEENLKRDVPRLAERLNLRVPRPPASTKSGVSRYEAWRLPPANEGSTGFVGVAIVVDLSGHGDIFGQIAEEIDHWRASLETPSYPRTRRRY